LIEISKRDPDELAREVREINRLAKIAGIPIGYQLGLFEDGKSVATAIEDEKAGDGGDPLKKLEAEGYVAGKAGKTMSACSFAEETPEHDAFMKGWKKATGENAGLKNTPAAPAAARKAAGKSGAANGATAH
jgi:ribosome modulation factor